ncbi:MAG: fibronectin type III domain-containing protein, partial [Sedimentisphaerales bacterium]|nr:fibronectin type III domain-containing protein [Sedimentisphaerales bacterium]
KYHPTFVADYGWAVDELIRDIASPDRNDPKYPYLRYFSPYAGHSFASGWYPSDNYQGNDQESSSEAMHAWSSVYQWGLITGNKTYRDLGLYLYWTEKSAIDQYWFDVDDETFIPDYNHILTVILRETCYEYTTYFGSHPEYFYGIQTMPITPSTMYAGVNQVYALKFWEAFSNDNAIADGGTPYDHWDLRMQRIWALVNPIAALGSFVYNKPNLNAETDVISSHNSWASQYYFLNNLALLGNVSTDFYADVPSYGVFKRNGEYNFMAYNPEPTNITVHFKDSSNNVVLTMGLDPDQTLYDVYTADLAPASPNLTNLTVVGKTATLNWTSANRATSYILYYGTASNVVILPLNVGNTTSYSFTNMVQGKIYYFKVAAVNGNGESTPSKTLTTGPDPDIQLIPGKIEAENFLLPFGVATGSCNEGGLAVGWIDTGDYIDYQVDVADTGVYTADFRIASESVGGSITVLTGPADPTTVVGSTTFTATGAWDSWKTVSNVALNLTAGRQILRLYATTGGFNINWFEITWNGGALKPVKAVFSYAQAKDKMINLGWNSALYSENYWVRYGTSSGSYTQVTNVGSNLSAILTNLVNGTTYYMTVSGSNSVGDGHWADEWTMEPRDTSSEPAAPTALHVSDLSSNSYTLDWTDNATNESAYLLYVSQVDLMPDLPAEVLPANTVSWSTNGLTPGQTLYFWLTATNTFGSSDAVTTNVTTIIPPNPYALKVNNIGGNRVQFSIKFPNEKSIVQLFAKRNNVEDYSPNIESSKVNNGDGTYSYSIIRTGVYANGDIIVARVYSVTPGNVTTYSPGPAATQWYDPYTNQNLVVTNAPELSGFSATASSSNIINLSWSDDYLNAKIFRVYQNTENTQPGTFTSIASNKYSMAVSNLTPETPYYFWLDATNAYGTSVTYTATATTRSTESGTGPLSTLVVENIGSLAVSVSITFSETKDICNLFFKKNGAPIYENLSMSYINNGNGTYTYQTNLTGFISGDKVSAYVYTAKAGQAWFPGPTSSTWTPEVTVSDAVKPDMPVSVSAVSGDRTVTLNWDAVTNAQGYKIRFGRSSGGYTAVRLTGNVTSYTVTNLLNERNYYFTVIATNDWQVSSNSTEVLGHPVPAEYNRPILAEPVAGDSSVSLDWSAVRLPGSLVNPIVNYTVRVGTASQRYFMETSVGQLTNLTLTNLTNDVNYYFSVNALVTADGGVRKQVMGSLEKQAMPSTVIPSIVTKGPSFSYIYTPVVSASVVTTPVIETRMVLAPVEWAGLLAGDSLIKAGWVSDPEVESYSILAGLESGNYTLTNTVKTAQEAVLKGLKNDSRYYVTVKATRKGAVSAYSQEMSVVPEAGLYGRLDWKSVVPETEAVLYNWSEAVLPAANKGMTVSYTLKIKAKGHVLATEIPTGSKTSCRVSNMKKGMTYSATVSAVVTDQSGLTMTLPDSKEIQVKIK